jgi:hypothetical protein
VNVGAWVLRNIGEVTCAREDNAIAQAGARETAYRELEVYAALDPCDDLIAERDVVRASELLATAQTLMDDVYAYRWRHYLRVDLLHGRIALARGDPDIALGIAERLITAAAGRRAPRYTQLGAVLRAQARAALGEEPPSPALLAELSSSLSNVAGIEAWWLMADLGASLGSEACFTHAHSHRDRLAAQLVEPRRAAFLRYAGTRLESTRTRGQTA